MSAQTKGNRARHVKEIRRSARKFSTVLRLMSAQKLVIMAIRKWYDTWLCSHYHYKWHFNCSLIWNQLLSTSWKSHTSCSVLFDPNNVVPVFQEKLSWRWNFEWAGLKFHPWHLCGQTSSSLDLPIPRFFFPAVSPEEVCKTDHCEDMLCWPLAINVHCYAPRLSQNITWDNFEKRCNRKHGA